MYDTQRNSLVYGLQRGTLWNFQGRIAGLPATVASLLVLAVGIRLFSPRRKVQAPVIDPDPIAENASSENIDIINYAPESLQPANTLRLRKRRPGASFKNFRNMASELFRS